MDHLQFQKRRTDRFRRLAVLAALAMALLCLPVCAYDGGEETQAMAVVEAFLRGYEEEAMLYEARDLRPGTVADPSLPSLNAGTAFRFGKRSKTLAELRENIAFWEKKADFYATMRQIQHIYRENLELTYTFTELELSENTGQASVTETASFLYTDSDRLSVYEAFYSVYLVKLDGHWLVAYATDGSQFDSDHRDDPAFDVPAALAEFAAQLQTDRCTVSYPLTAGSGIPYNGANAAAYAYTYSRQKPGMAQEDFYNPQFESYAGNGGDCMNFASQCMWAGFGGSQTASAIDGHEPPMDASGNFLWYAHTPSSNNSKIALGWISCQSFRKYLTGSTSGAGDSGSNAGTEDGMYATILDVGAGSGLSGVPAGDLLGAVAHVEGSGGPYAHAIVLTAATGTSRSEIWFCGHTKDITHLKLGDYYIGPMKVYIPRFLRTGAPQDNVIQPERIPPVTVLSSARLAFHTAAPQQWMTVAVTAPDGGVVQESAANASECAVTYPFELEGMYKVECTAQPGGNAAANKCVYYVRCRGEEPEAEPEEEPSSEMPEWLRPTED